MKKKKSTAKPKIKLKSNGKYAAVLTLRIPPDHIAAYDELIKFTNRKTYTDAIDSAVHAITKIDTELKDTKKKLQETGEKYLIAMRKISLMVQSHTELSDFVKKNAKDIPAVKEREAEKYCRDCNQFYIDDGYGCPSCY